MATEDSNEEFQFKDNDTILSDMIDTVMIRNNDVNDFTPGSILRTLLESESLELETLYYLQLENLNHAIDESVLQAFDFDPIDYVHAFGNIIIYFTDTLQKDLYIPQGTRFASSNKAYNQVYSTITAYTAPQGTNAIELVVYCENDNNIGSYGNVPKGVIDTTPDMSGIAYLTNPEDILTGQDSESIEDTRIRFRAYIQSLAMGTRQALRYAVMAVPGVTGCAIYEASYGSVTLYVHDANGNLNDDLAEEVAEAVAQYKPAGIQVIIRPIHKTLVNLDVALDVKYAEYETDEYLEYIRQGIVNYLNTFQVEDMMYLNKVTQYVLDNNEPVRDVKISYEVVPDITMRDDAYAPDDSVATIGTYVVTQDYLKDPDIVTNDTYGYPSPHDPLEEAGQTWKDAKEVTDEDGDTSYEAIDLYSNYESEPNELLRAGDVTVEFGTGDEIIPVAHITVDKTEVEIMTGQKYSIRTSVFPQNATDKKLKFISSNVNIASVDDTGMVRTLAPGEADILIQATDASQISTKVHFVVKGEAVAGYNLLLDTATEIKNTGTNKENQILGEYAFSQGKLSTWIEQGTKYTLSFDWESRGDTKGKFYPQFDASPWGGGMADSLTVDVSVTDKGHMSATFTADNSWSISSATALQFRADNLTKDIKISHVQLERGTSETEWGESPDD